MHRRDELLVVPSVHPPAELRASALPPRRIDRRRGFGNAAGALEHIARREERLDRARKADEEIGLENGFVERGRCDARLERERGFPGHRFGIGRRDRGRQRDEPRDA